MKIRFITGQKLRFTCSRCGSKKDGIVYRDLYTWRTRMSCGHEREIGFTKPMDILEAEGFIET